MYARVVPEGKVWRDGFNYRDTDELLRKARDVLYGEGKGNKKPVPDMVFVGRDMNGHNYNLLSFGSEVTDESSQIFPFVFKKLSDLVSLLNAMSPVEIVDWHIYNNYDKLTFRVRYKLQGMQVKNAYSLITTDELGNAVIKNVESFLRDCGCIGLSNEYCNTVSDIIKKLNHAITLCFKMFEIESVNVDSLSVYRLNPLNTNKKGYGRVYKGFGLATRENYHDVICENPYEYRMSVFVEF